MPGGPVISHARVEVDNFFATANLGGLKCFTRSLAIVPLALKTTLEGRTLLCVPADSLTRKVPVTNPVFFNPAARLNRDISVAVASVTGPETYLDALAGTGARGVRISNEAAPEARVVLVDFNEAALSLAAKSLRKNRLASRCKLVHSEANRYLYSRFERDEKFDAVDVDPFGTPAPYIQAALVASGEGAMLSFTATDAAVLCGVYPEVASRRYGSAIPRSEFVHETALRILAGFAARMGGINDIGVDPVGAHSTLHYLRVYLRVRRGASAADESQKSIGYVTQCNGCHERFSGTTPDSRCQQCGTRVHPAGPLWIGKLCDEKVLTPAARYCDEQGWTGAAETVASMKGVDGFPPFSYSLERAASRLGSSSVPVEKVIGVLRSAGFRCMKQPFEELSLKTDASREEVEDAVNEVSRSLA